MQPRYGQDFGNYCQVLLRHQWKVLLRVVVKYQMTLTEALSAGLLSIDLLEKENAAAYGKSREEKTTERNRLLGMLQWRE
mgnify:CR=1 FL=1